MRELHWIFSLKNSTAEVIISYYVVPLEFLNSVNEGMSLVNNNHRYSFKLSDLENWSCY